MAALEKSILPHFHELMLFTLGVFLLPQMVKNLPAMQETWVQSLGWEDPLEKEMATHYSILAWRIPWTEEPGRLQYMGSQRVGQDWATSLLLSENKEGITVDKRIWLGERQTSSLCHGDFPHTPGSLLWQWCPDVALDQFHTLTSSPSLTETRPQVRVQGWTSHWPRLTQLLIFRKGWSFLVLKYSINVLLESFL